MPNQQCQSTKGTTERIIIIIHEYYYGGAVALLLQDHLTMSVTEQSQCLSTTVQREHKTREGKRESPGKEECLWPSLKHSDRVTVNVGFW